MQRFAVLLVAAAVIGTGCASTVRTVNEESFHNLTQVTFHDKNDFEPAALADGSKLLFVSNRDGDYNIYLKDVNARAVVKKTFHGSNDVQPVMSPDGSQFAFASNRNGNYDVFIMNVTKGRAKIQVTDSDYNEMYPSWSPDGKKIAFAQYSLVDLEWYIWVKNIDTGQLTQIGMGILPQFSPDGTKVLYKKAGRKGYYELWVMDLDGENDTQIVSNDKWGVGTFCWSPDGGAVMFSTGKGTGSKSSRNANPLAKPRTDLWTVRVDGSVLTQITTHKGKNTDPQWTESGEVFFVSDRDSKVNIWRFTME